jgi:ATP-dependent DNA helicase RecG
MELFEVKMSIPIDEITEPQTKTIRLIEEGQFSEAKAILISPAKLTKTISAFANSDGGDLYVGISEAEVAPEIRTV